MSENGSQGIIQIADDVVAVIASLAATKTKGVAGMSGGITEGWAKRVGGKSATRGVSVEVGQLEAAIDLRVIVKYGEKIHEVAHQLQRDVKEAVETMTGLNVVEVNVKVEGVELQEVEEEDRVK
ncbi:MAG: Asp23/Gls24 family envelope stress response protein [Planifilum sp.]|jgi:uncharacterized alkaline shock family protein YloU